MCTLLANLMRIAAIMLALLTTELGKASWAGPPSVKREGSSLSIHWSAAEPGAWEITDAQGHVCLAGEAKTGANTLDLVKVAAPTELRFRTRNARGAKSEILIPAIKTISPLLKPQRSSTIYQIPVRTYFARGNGEAFSGRFNDLTDERLREIRALGVDYLWLTGVLEQASRAQTDPDVVKGEAGSYYAIYDKWDVSSQLGTMADFERLIARTHAHGLRILIDFVANHTSRMHRTDVVCKTHLDFGRGDRTDVFFDANNNYFYLPGTEFTPPPLDRVDGVDGVFDTDIFTPGVQKEIPARVTGNDAVSASPAADDWFETAKLNYGFDIERREGHYSPRPKTWTQMIDVARYWIEKGIDGFRVDFAHAVPMEFWQEFARELRAVNPEVFLLAEAYERDERMKVPGFSYYAMMRAGFDSVYSSEMYWGMHRQVAYPGGMRSANPLRTPVMAERILERGFSFTHYMENHDELRLASRYFAPWLGDRATRARLGLAYTAYVGLLPGHLMLHGGQELQEDASNFGGFAGDNGRTSIFDFLQQNQTRRWNSGDRPQWMREFRDRYASLLTLKLRPAFSAAHSLAAPSFVDLDSANFQKNQSKWIASYVRYIQGEAYLVVLNSDPYGAHEATVHFTDKSDHDSLGALHALGVENGTRRYRFVEVFSRPGYTPVDPAVSGEGLPGWALYRSGGIPSGLYLGEVPAATAYVFKVEEL